MLNVATPSLVRPVGLLGGKTDYWYVMYHEVVDEETMLDHGKTHIDSSESPPHFATLRDLLEYAVKRSNLPYPRITLEAVTCLTLFGQRYVALGEKVRPNAVYHATSDRGRRRRSLRMRRSKPTPKRNTKSSLISKTRAMIS